MEERARRREYCRDCGESYIIGNGNTVVCPICGAVVCWRCTGDHAAQHPPPPPGPWRRPAPAKRTPLRDSTRSLVDVLEGRDGDA